jgi:hypothetical protein
LDSADSTERKEGTTGESGMGTREGGEVASEFGFGEDEGIGTDAGIGREVLSEVTEEGDGDGVGACASGTTAAGEGVRETGSKGIRPSRMWSMVSCREWVRARSFATASAFTPGNIS